MRICFFAHDQFIANGATRSMIDLIKKLREREIDSIVVIRQHGTLEDTLKEEGIKYYIKKTCALTVPADSRVSYITKMTNGVRLLYNYFAVSRLACWIKKEDIDIVHINKAVGIGGALLAKKLKVPCIWHLREYLDYDYNRKFVFENYVYRLMKTADQIIAISDDVKVVWEKRLRINNIVRVYNAVPDQRVVEHDFQGNEVPMDIIMVGAITEGKGQLIALEAIKRLRTMGKRPTLKIVGSAVSYSYEQKVRDYIAKNELSDCVEIIPYTKDVYSIRKKVTIGLLCSSREAFGRVTVETMLSGLLFVGSDTGGTPELVKDGVTGYLYKYGDVDDLVNKLILAVSSKDDYFKVVRNAQRYAAGTFSLDNTANRIIKVYQRELEMRN